MLVGLKVGNRPLLIAEIPDRVEFVPTGLGQPDVRLDPTKTTLCSVGHLYSKIGRHRGYSVSSVQPQDFTGTTHIVAGMFGYRKVEGRPVEASDYLPNTTHD
jgi:hypothetical protein